MIILNRSAARRYALEFALANRPKFTRVSQEFLDRIEARAKAVIQAEVQRHPSLGVTLK